MNTNDRVSDERLAEMIEREIFTRDRFRPGTIGHTSHAENLSTLTELKSLRSASTSAKAERTTIQSAVQQYLDAQKLAHAADEAGKAGYADKGSYFSTLDNLPGFVAAALSALEDAAQPEFVSQEPTPSATQGDLTIAREKQIEQEPVAWRCEDLILPGISIIDDWEHAQSRMSQPNAWRVTPLYTHLSTPATGRDSRE